MSVSDMNSMSLKVAGVAFGWQLYGNDGRDQQNVLKDIMTKASLYNIEPWKSCSISQSITMSQRIQLLHLDPIRILRFPLPSLHKSNLHLQSLQSSR